MNNKQYIRQQLSVWKNFIFKSLIGEVSLIKKTFKDEYGFDIDLEHPKTFSEKLQWIKLNDHKEIYHTMADKYDCKSLITNIAGGGTLYPLSAYMIVLSR